MNLRPRMLAKKEEMEGIVHEAQVCYLGLSDQGMPYVLPMNFVYESGVLYLHSAAEGYKMEIMKANAAVCINFNIGNELFYRHKDVGCSWGMKFKSVNIFGQAKFIDDYDEKYRIMQCFMRKFSGENYEFSEPSIKNVVVIRVDVQKMTGKVYGY